MTTLKSESLSRVVSPAQNENPSSFSQVRAAYRCMRLIPPALDTERKQISGVQCRSGSDSPMILKQRKSFTTACRQKGVEITKKRGHAKTNDNIRRCERLGWASLWSLFTIRRELLLHDLASAPGSRQSTRKAVDLPCQRRCPKECVLSSATGNILLVSERSRRRGPQRWLPRKFTNVHPEWRKQERTEILIAMAAGDDRSTGLGLRFA